MKNPALQTLPGGTRLVRPWRPAAVLAASLLVFAIGWLAVLDLSSLAPPVDNIEQLTWSHSLQWGYPKHPPFSTFVLWCVAELFGWSKWSSYVLGASMTLGAIAILWGLLRELRGTTYAAIAILAVLCITFYNGRLYYYNHNVVLMPLAVISAVLCWRAFEQKKLRWWIALGFVLGLGALTKYQVIVTVASLACFWCSQRGWRDPAHRTGALLAALVSLIVLTPHVWWLREHDFGPISYGVGRSLAGDLPQSLRLLAALNWLADEVLNRAAPAFLLLWVSIRFFRDRRANFLRGSESLSPSRPSARALLMAWGLVPLIFAPLVCLLSGADPQTEWGTPFLLFAIPCAMELRPPAQWNALALRKVAMTFAGFQALLVAQTVVASPIGVPALRDRHWRAFPAHKLMEQVAPEARGRLGGRIAVVAGPIGEAGALALELPEHPAVWIDGRFDRSPGLRQELVAACGALELDFAPGEGGQLVGPQFPGLYWRARLPTSAAGAGACEERIAAGPAGNG